MHINHAQRDETRDLSSTAPGLKSTSQRASASLSD